MKNTAKRQNGYRETKQLQRGGKKLQGDIKMTTKRHKTSIKGSKMATIGYTFSSSCLCSAVVVELLPVFVTKIFFMSYTVYVSEKQHIQTKLCLILLINSSVSNNVLF